MASNKSPRQELADFFGDGRLREMAEKARLSSSAVELLITVVGRYCTPRTRRRRRSLRPAG